MRPLPVADPGTPDTRSATRYLVWLARTNWLSLTGAAVLGMVWWVGQALAPALIGRAIDAGLTERDGGALLAWGAALMGLAGLIAVSGITRHRLAVYNWLCAAYRTVQVTIAHTNRLGASLPRRVAAGEVVSIGTADVSHVGGALDITSRGTGSVVAIVVLTWLLLRASVPLGLVVLIGVPVLMAIVGLLIRPMHLRQQAYREQQGALIARASDIVTGLRVLRGVGGEAVFAARYREESQRLRAAGIRVARVEALLEAAQLLLPGGFVVLVTWLGARFALDGRITVGQLVAFYGYTVFLVHPLRTLTEAADKVIRGHVAARRVVRVLALAPDLSDPAYPLSAPDTDGDLVDIDSGVVVRPGLITAIAAAVPEDAERIADRLGRYVDGEVRLSGVPLRDLELAAVRERILVADNDARLFRGPLRVELDVRGGADDARLTGALATASALDVIEALPAGLDTVIAERGRDFSGGQQQRLKLARALVADPPILVLVEPTSAVDAHTEARIAAALPAARRGRTTVVCTTSPLVLDHADRVVYVEGGRVVAEGTHRELLDTQPQYVATVTRGEA